jgi:putative transposase
MLRQARLDVPGLLPQIKTACYARLFIPNHAHFLFLNKACFPFHDNEKRPNRYKSIVCQEGAYLKVIARHIHLNLLEILLV